MAVSPIHFLTAGCRHKKAEQLYEIIYTSIAARPMSFQTFKNFAFNCCRSNSKAGISGLLVFDGVMFCQHLEGPAGTIFAVFKKIERDDRHQELKVIYKGALKKKRFRHFSIKTTGVGGVSLLSNILEIEIEHALRALAGIIQFLDV